MYHSVKDLVFMCEIVKFVHSDACTATHLQIYARNVHSFIVFFLAKEVNVCVYHVREGQGLRVLWVTPKMVYYATRGRYSKPPRFGMLKCSVLYKSCYATRGRYSKPPRFGMLKCSVLYKSCYATRGQAV